MIADDLVATEFYGAEKMLEGLPLPAATQQFTQGREVSFGDGLVETEVEIESAAAEDVSEEVLHVEPSFLDFSFLQIGCARLEDFEKGLHRRVSNADAEGVKAAP